MRERGDVFVGVAVLELHLPGARSLKEKRGELRPLVERIRARHQVLVTEVGGQDLHQRAALAICAISTSPSDLEDRLARVRSLVDGTWSGNVLSWELDVLKL